VFAAKNEAALDQVWHYDDALRIAQYFFRNTFVRSSHDGLQNLNGRLQTRNRIFASRACQRIRSTQTHQTKNEQ
jgi:hypothetical protein